MKNTVFYTRVSTGEQTTHRQVESIQNYCKYKNYNIINSYDEKVSGMKGEDEREQLKKMMEFIRDRNNNVEVLVVWEISRLGRRLHDVSSIAEELMNLNISLHAMNNSIITIDDDGKLNPTGKMMVNLLTMFSELERDYIVSRSRSGLERNSKMLGHWTGGRLLPYGFKRDNKKLVIDEEESEIIKDIFNYYLNDGMGTTQIADKLDERGVLTRYNKAYKDKKTEVRTSGISKPADKFKWKDGTIYTILTNPIYKGERMYLGDIIRIPFIIEPARFDEVQRRLSENSSRGRDVKHFYLLENIQLKCGICGKTYFPYKKSSGKENRYLCLSKRYREDCGNHGINIYRMENGAWYVIKRTKYLRQHIQESMERSDVNKEIQEKETLQTDFANQLTNLLKKEKFYSDLFYSDDISEQEFKERNTLIKIDRIKLARNIDKLQGEINQLKEYRNIQNDINNQLGTIKEDKYLMKDYIEKIVKKMIVHPIKDDFVIGSIRGDKNFIIELHLKSSPIPINYIISQRSSAILILNEGEFKDNFIIGKRMELKRRIGTFGWKSENHQDPANFR